MVLLRYSEIGDDLNLHFHLRRTFDLPLHPRQPFLVLIGVNVLPPSQVGLSVIALRAAQNQIIEFVRATPRNRQQMIETAKLRVITIKTASAEEAPIAVHSYQDFADLLPSL